MLTVGFVVTPGFPLMSLAALSVFEFANYSAGEKIYDVQVLSEGGAAIPTASGPRLETTAFGDPHFDTLIIGGNTCVVPTSPGLIGFIADAAKTSRRISSICTGIFASADAGVLGNRRVTTHWLFTEELKARFSKVHLEENRIFIVDGPIWTGRRQRCRDRPHVVYAGAGLWLRSRSIRRPNHGDRSATLGRTASAFSVARHPPQIRPHPERAGICTAQSTNLAFGRESCERSRTRPTPVQSGISGRNSLVTR